MTDWLTDKIDCAEMCEVPPGRAMCRMPTPRYAWTDIMRCPNCGQYFLVRPLSDVPTKKAAPIS